MWFYLGEDMSNIKKEFEELCEQCKNNDSVEYVTFDALDEFFKLLKKENK